MLIAEVPGQLIDEYGDGKGDYWPVLVNDRVLIIFLKFAEEVQQFCFKQLTDSFLFVF